MIPRVSDIEPGPATTGARAAGGRRLLHHATHHIQRATGRLDADVAGKGLVEDPIGQSRLGPARRHLGRETIIMIAAFSKTDVADRSGVHPTDGFAEKLIGPGLKIDEENRALPS